MPESLWKSKEVCLYQELCKSRVLCLYQELCKSRELCLCRDPCVSDEEAKGLWNYKNAARISLEICVNIRWLLCM